MDSNSPLTKGKIGREQLFLVPFRQFVSLLAMEHNDVGETGLKRVLNLIWAVRLHVATYNMISKLNCTVYSLFR